MAPAVRTAFEDKKVLDDEQVTTWRNGSARLHERLLEII
jgi:hypothetical protein